MIVNESSCEMSMKDEMLSLKYSSFAVKEKTSLLLL